MPREIRSDAIDRPCPMMAK